MNYPLKYDIPYINYEYKDKYGIEVANAIKGFIYILIKYLPEEPTQSQLDKAFEIGVTKLNISPAILTCIMRKLYDTFDTKYKSVCKNPDSIFEASGFLNAKELYDEDKMNKYFKELVKSKLAKYVSDLIS
jgi:hypothetical protein